ncbi:hypothetical protein TELCIR_04845 [Teladorsagia circumcincta]|uniref:Uncharacterized protein n=1 Tax=Teladorsagia circumcincta TaxID=45464 RepID=A0A2G9USI2_TELCI|nr:hypothetical protein TELCIR_04845 [Teladorsagia circumcincta]
MMLPAFAVAFVVGLHLQLSHGQVVKWDHTKPIITAFGDRNGHNYLYKYDYISSRGKYEHTGVAVRVGLNEISFSQYGISNYYNNKHCMSFLTLRGTENTCNRYFLLVDDWYSFERKTWDQGFSKSGCKMVQFYTSVLVFIKYDVLDDTSPKFVGTYSVTRDRLYYFGKDGARVMISNFKRRIDVGLMSPTKYEVVCAKERTW